MEGNRGAVLVVDAAVQGRIDFSRARIDDPEWWRYMRVMMTGMERERDRDMYRIMYDMQLALVSNGKLTDESWKNSLEAVDELKADLIGTYRPWDGRNFQERKKREMKDWRQRYIDAFDVDPLDPEFQKWEAETIRKLEEATYEEETDEQRVARLLRERDARQ